MSTNPFKGFNPYRSNDKKSQIPEIPESEKTFVMKWMGRWLAWSKKKRAAVELGKFLIYLTIPLCIVFVSSQPTAQKAMIDIAVDRYGNIGNKVEVDPDDHDKNVAASKFHQNYERSQEKIKKYLEMQKNK
jgi:hypothetical protein